ncbi:MAG: choice-of-anchor D domain-containing protein [Deltaproteobacteria bacterium]|nr:choice-of-anchor D domain-containing protein [Deltaproteobacteria bacterium]
MYRWTPLLAGLVAGGCECGAPELIALEARPALVVSSLDFQEVPVGAQRTLTTALDNDGNLALTVLAISFEPATAVFSVEVQPNPVPPLGSSLLVARFSPPAVAPYLATATLASDAESDVLPPLQLRGVGVEPLISVDPTRLDFGDLAYGATRLLRVQVHNARGFDQSVETRVEGSGAASFGLLATGPAGLMTAPAFSSTALDVTFGPRAGGVHEAMLRLDFCGVGCGLSVGLVGRCAEPRIAVEPLQVDFGVLATGESAVRGFTVRNDGLSPLTVNRVELVGAGTDFTLPSPPAALTLAAGADAAIEVAFAPTRAGEQSAQVILESDDPAAPTGRVHLIGRRSGSDLVAVPLQLEYGVVAGAGPHLRSVLLVNRGDEPAAVLSSEIVGSSRFALVPPLVVPFAVAGGATAVLDVSFAPDVAGNQFSTLRLTTDLPQRPLLEVALAGTLGESTCALVPDADAVRFGAVLVGSSSVRALTLTNLGSAACGVAAIAFSPVFVNDPAISFAAPPLPLLEPGASFGINLAFAPRSAGPAKAVLAIQASQPELPPSLVGISGTGARGGLVAAPPSLDFGNAAVDCGVTERWVSVSNIGSSTVVLQPPRLDPTGSAAFSIRSSGGSGHQLSPGESRLIGVGFEPRVAGIHVGALIVDAGSDVVGVVVPLTGEAVIGLQTTVTESFSVAAGVSLVDILFVVDNSGSMADNQDNLAANFNRFIRAADFRGLQVDFQIGVTTTDLDGDQGAGGRLVGSPRILNRNSYDLEGSFTASVRQGVEGSGWEQGLAAAFAALSPPLVDDPAYNLGFLRPEAALAVVVVSDEDDQSPQPVAFYAGFLDGLKASAAAEAPPVLFNAVTGGSGGCQSDSNAASPAPRYQEMVALTGGRSMSICAVDWGEELEELGTTIFLAATTRFQLSGRPQPGSISVSVNGVQVPASQYRYDAASQTVIFDAEYALEPGDVVEVSYVLAC